MANLVMTSPTADEPCLDARVPARASHNLTLVAPSAPGERAHELFREARSISLVQLNALAAQIDAVCELLESVVDAGELYVPGVSEFSARLHEDLFWRSKTLAMLSLRQQASIVRPRERC
jgi:hypothetical protein